MITVRTVINLQNIIFDEECGQNFDWKLYQNENLSIKLCRSSNQISIIVEEKYSPLGLEQENIDQRSRLHFEKVMALLRVYRKGNVQANGFQFAIDGLPSENRIFPYMISWGPRLFSFYTLKIVDKDMLTSLFGYFEQLEIENTSIHWFSYAPFRPIIRDRLIDYVIALESMFIEYSLNPERRGSGKKTTLKNRGKNIFNLLDYGNDIMPSITDWNGFVDNFYDYRSRIVHGAKKDDQPPEEDVIKIVDNLEIICRAFLKKFLKDGVLFDWDMRKRSYNW